jgi:tRNA(Ile)-lysidine synthase
VKPGAFSQQWLFARLSRLLPDFPAVSVCVALSGGLDSAALLTALATPRRARPHLRALHIDHGLHPNSRLWSAHCRRLARQLKVPLQVLATKVTRIRGESLEAAARTARYGLLEAHLAPGEVLLTAHHEDDQLETVLLQLFRGSGLAGISAMPEITAFGHGLLARPLLSCTRSQLEEWATSIGLTWVEDDTNADESLDRNYLRRRVLPLLRARWPAVASSVGRSARHAAQAQRLLDEVARRDVERAADGDCLAASVLRALRPERRRNALRFWIVRAGFTVPDTRRLEEICGALLEARPDANPRVSWGDAVVQRERGRLSIARGERGSSAPVGRRSAAQGERGSSGPVGRRPAARVGSFEPDRIWSWTAQRSCKLAGVGGGELELRPDPRGPLDLDALPRQLTVRSRVGGERLRPRKGGPTRALKSLLQEAHVPLSERSRLPLVCSGHRLLAVADLWLDESIQAGAGARRRGRLRWRR